MAYPTLATSLPRHLSLLFATLLVCFYADLCNAADARHEQLLDPIPVTVVRVYDLPFFCVTEGLQASPASNRQPDGTKTSHFPGEPCSGVRPRKKPRRADRETSTAVIVPPGNADDIAKQLQPQAVATANSATVAASAAASGAATATATGTGGVPPNEFALTATEDKYSEVIFCKIRHCDDPKKLLDVLYRLAKPKYSYFEDYTVTSEKLGKRLVKAIPVINPKLKAELIDTVTVRVESSQPLSAAELVELDKNLKRDQDAIVTELATVPPTDPDEQKQIKKDLAGAAADVQVATVDLPSFCQSNDLQTPPAAPEKDVCPTATRNVPAGNVDTIILAVNAALVKSTSKFTVSRDGNRILVACDTKCAGDTLQLIQDTITATARPVPFFVQDVAVLRGTSDIAVRFLNVAPLAAKLLTATSVRVSSEIPVTDTELALRLERIREYGFGPSEIPPLQRMFYRAAGDVIGDLLSTPSPGAVPALGANAAAAPVTGTEPAAATTTAAASATTTPAAPAGTTISITNNPAATPTAAATPTPGPAPIGTVGLGMTAVGDDIVFTDTSSPSAVRQRARLLTMIDLPRPEVLMNMWSFQASSPDGKEVAQNLQKIRDLVSAHNDALQHAIDYGWAYLSRQMKDPDFFEPTFYNYVTQRFVADTAECEAKDPTATGCLTDKQRMSWGLCKQGQYCLGYQGAFQPLRPTLTSILLGMMAAKQAHKTVLTTIACMEGKYEVYPEECFPSRKDLEIPSVLGLSRGDPKACLQTHRADFLQKIGAGEKVNEVDVIPETESQKSHTVSCEILDRAAVYAQKECGLPITLPLSCFTLQAAKSFLPENSFSTFSLQQLNSLAEKRIADGVDEMYATEKNYSASTLGLLRSSVADFLFNYKVSQEYPGEFNTYDLPHSAQELNAQFNPLVVAFNQDVAALSRNLLEEAQNDVPNQNNFFELWRHNKSYIANGLVTVRGISGLESLVDTDTQNSFDSTQAQTLGAVLSSITGASSSAAASATNQNTNTNTINVNPDGSSTGSGTPAATAPNPLTAVGGLFRGASSSLAIATALAALTPVKSHSIIGRQLTLDIIPHALPGASSAELDVRLWAQEDSAPTIYSETGSSSNDYVSRVARHNVATRVRVESVKLFDVSTFTAMIQRPRAKLPIVPPFIEIPLIGSILSIPLPAAKVYHASSAIVSAIIVPTAFDLAYGLVFKDDRAVVREDKTFSKLPFSLRVVTSQYQLPETAFVRQYHGAMLKCIATNNFLSFTGTSSGPDCSHLTFSDLPPER